jgi:hypothetical protein
MRELPRRRRASLEPVTLLACLVLGHFMPRTRSIRRSTPASKRTLPGRSVTAFRKAQSCRSPKRGTGISDWAPSSDCFGSTGCGRFHGSRRQKSSRQATTSEVCLRRAMELFKSAPPPDWRVGGTANSSSTQKLEGRAVWTLIEDREGTVWAAGHGGALRKALRDPERQRRLRRGRRIFGQYIDALFQDQAGSIWGGGANGLT